MRGILKTHLQIFLSLIQLSVLLKVSEIMLKMQDRGNSGLQKAKLAEKKICVAMAVNLSQRLTPHWSTCDLVKRLITFVNSYANDAAPSAHDRSHRTPPPAEQPHAPLLELKPFFFFLRNTK